MAQAELTIARTCRGPSGSLKNSAPVVIATMGTMTVEMPETDAGKTLAI